MTNNENKTLSIRLLKSKLSLGILFLFSISLSISMPQNRLHAPSARMAIQDAVPFSFVEKIAVAKANQVWGEGALGKPIPLCDPSGGQIAWMFSYIIGSPSFPTYNELLQQIKMGRELKELVDRSDFHEAKLLYNSLLTNDSRRALVASTPVSPVGANLGQIEPIRSDGSLSKRAQAAETTNLLKYGADKAIGAGEFGTIVVSATYGKVPVPVYLHCLSPYYTHFDLALEKARTFIGEGASLQRIYFLRLRGLFFEFANNDYSIVLHAQTLEPTDMALYRKSQERSLPHDQATAAAREKINNLWTELEHEIKQ
jgi:hypothetical protein